MEFLLMMIHVTQKDRSLVSAEAMVSNHSTMGCIPHEAGQLNPYAPTLSSQFWDIHTLVM